jgi:hypothetical protein
MAVLLSVIQSGALTTDVQTFERLEQQMCKQRIVDYFNAQLHFSGGALSY